MATETIFQTISILSITLMTIEIIVVHSQECKNSKYEFMLWAKNDLQFSSSQIILKSDNYFLANKWQILCRILNKIIHNTTVIGKAKGILINCNSESNMLKH